MQKVKNISFKNVDFNSGFWKFKYDLTRDVSVKSVYNRFEETGRFDALRFNYAEGKPKLHIFFDSDVAKWIETVAYFIEKDSKACKEEQEVIDALVLDMKKNQYENGYINSYFIQIAPDKIFTDRDCHELYCAGHLIEAAIAYERATGKSGLMEIMDKYIDHIITVFQKENSAQFSTPGHEEIELALLKLYGYKGDEKYLSLAMNFIDKRGVVEETPIGNNWANRKYDQSEIPVRELTMAEGHAVRACYLYIAMSEAALKTGDELLKKACERLFDDIVKRRMYITGGIGSAKQGESLSVPYDLPNLEAYSESCAAIGLVYFAHSMQQFGLNARYANLIEQVMYNNMLSSESIDGKAFFYENPLEYHLASVDKETCMLPHNRTKLPIRHRLEVFGCSCCPPNITRTFAKMGDFFFSECENSLVINQFGSLTLNNDKVELEMVTEYPQNGKININVKRSGYDKIYIRKPDWCDAFEVSVSYSEQNGYIVVDGNLSSVNVSFEMQPFFIESNPKVRANNGRVALMYGPIVYCLERLDNDYELNALTVDVDADVTVTSGDGFFPMLEARGWVDDGFESLYRKVKADKSPVNLHFIPYWTFANRDECDMIVWVRKA